MTAQRIAIAGAGVLGRLAAWALARAGHAVTVFDPAAGPEAPPAGQVLASARAAGFTAAGMLSPVAELDGAGPDVARLGWRSLPLWAQVANALAQPELVRRSGSLLLSHGSDLGAAQRVLARLAGGPPDLPAAQALSATDLRALEPALAPALHAWLLPGEGQVLPRELLMALATQAPGVCWRWGERVQQAQPGRLKLADGSVWQADWVFDLRGLGARGDGLPMHALKGDELPMHTLRGDDLPMHALRGVRGEILWLHAPGVALARPVRLLHPRHRVYLVPRPGDIVVVGASEIESEDAGPVSLRSSVELLAAAHSVIPELAEARIVHLEANLRPALPSNHPHTQVAAGLVAINGLFRHGWLLAPALLVDALAQAGLTHALAHAQPAPALAPPVTPDPKPAATPSPVPTSTHPTNA